MGSKFLFVPVETAELSFTSDVTPTPHDLEAVAAGLVTIFRTVDLHQLDANGVWHPLAAGVLAAPEIEGRENDTFHVHPSYL